MVKSLAPWKKHAPFHAACKEEREGSTEEDGNGMSLEKTRKSFES